MKRAAPRRVVIVGGGFGGLHLIRKLEWILSFFFSRMAANTP